VHTSTGLLRTRSFGVLEVDLRAAELRKFGITIKLLEQPFQLLALLLPHPGELVPRDEIRQALWPEHTLVDFGRASHRALDVVLAAATAGFVEAIALEARLAPGQIEWNSRNRSSGRAYLAALEKVPDHPPNQDGNRGLPRSTRA
jgi:hypothetical protein